MTQASRRPKRQRRRRSPTSFLLLLFFLLCSCVSTVWYTRANSAADAAYARLVGPDPVSNEQQSLAQTYQQIEKRRVSDGIREDYEGIIRDSKSMNSTLGKLEAADEKLLTVHNNRTEDFKASTRWLIGWTARRNAAKEITTLCDEITVLQSGALKLSKERNALLKEQNTLYISYSQDEISRDEFAEAKIALDERLAPVANALSSKLVAIEEKQGQIIARNTVIGPD